jgi:cysteine sulfinate desulfinase/cysteine desulfurase-like protein
MKKPIYLDYNGTTPHDPEVIAAMRPYLEEEFGNPSSPNRITLRSRALPGLTGTRAIILSPLKLNIRLFWRSARIWRKTALR